MGEKAKEAATTATKLIDKLPADKREIAARLAETYAAGLAAGMELAATEHLARYDYGAYQKREESRHDQAQQCFPHPGKRHPALFGSPDRAAAQAVLRAAPTQTDQQQDAGHSERRLGAADHGRIQERVILYDFSQAARLCDADRDGHGVRARAPDRYRPARRRAAQEKKSRTVVREYREHQ